MVYKGTRGHPQRGSKKHWQGCGIPRTQERGLDQNSWRDQYWKERQEERGQDKRAASGRGEAMLRRGRTTQNQTKFVPGGKPGGVEPTNRMTQVVELQAVNLINYFWAMYSTLLVG